MIREIACAVATLGVGYVTVRWWINRAIAHISTGAQRRSLYPPEKPIGPGAASVVTSADVSVRREVHDMKGGRKMFCQVLTPTKVAPSHVVVFLHGYTSQTDLYLEAAACLVSRGALVVMPDLPCHGRSDGLLTYVPDWWVWVDQLWEFLDFILPQVREQQSKPLPIFVGGISLGGGLAACLALQRPSYFNGVILLAPMLFVSDDIKPPWIVQQVFKFVLAPLLPTWPVTPTKGMDELDFRVPAQGIAYCTCNPMSMQGLKARLGTAASFGFTFPDWMETRLKDMKTPFIVLHGTADKITDPQASQRLYDEAAAADKTIRLIDGAYHCELFCCLPGNSKLIGIDWLPEQLAVTKQCFDDVGDWIAKRI